MRRDCRMTLNYGQVLSRSVVLDGDGDSKRLLARRSPYSAADIGFSDYFV
jgi:hypothetical protein